MTVPQRVCHESSYIFVMIEGPMNTQLVKNHTISLSQPRDHLPNILLTAWCNIRWRCKQSLQTRTIDIEEDTAGSGEELAKPQGRDRSNWSIQAAGRLRMKSLSIFLGVTLIVVYKIKNNWKHACSIKNESPGANKGQFGFRTAFLEYVA